MVKQSANNTADKADVSGVTALYVRVSTDAQYEEGYSIDAQEKKLKQWCELKDYSNYIVYQDGGWSGSNLDRPAMKRLIFDIIHVLRRIRFSFWRKFLTLTMLSFTQLMRISIPARRTAKQ